MTSKTSLFKKGLIFSDIKRFWWVSVLYGLLLFFMLPLRHLMLKNAVENEWTKRQLENALSLFHHQNNAQVLLIFVVPVLMAVLVFRYMQKPNAAAMVHSLPFNRKTLYFSHSASGLLLTAIPVILTALMLAILQITTNLGEYYSLGNIFQWLGNTLFFNSLFFSITVFVGIFTGNSVAQIAFTYILHMLPAGVYVLYRHNLQQLLHGYDYNGIYDSALDNLPMFILLNNRVENDVLSIQHLLAYGVLILLSFTVAYYVYKMRNIEVAGDVIAFTKVQPIFKYGVATCSMLLGGAYFSGILRGGFSTMLWGYIFSSLLGYFIAEMLMQKSFKVWSTYKGYVAYLAIVLIVLTGLKMDVTGYVARVPNSEDVEKVYFHYSLYPWNRFEEELTEANAMKDLVYVDNYFFRTEENIESIIKLHETLIQNSSPISGRSQYIIYTLKNGRHLIRQYIINEREYASLLKPIYESEEYKRGRFPLIAQEPEDVKLLEIVDYRSPKNPVMLAEPSKIQALVKLLQEEIKNVSFEELTFSERNAPRIIITDNEDRRIDYAIRNSYTSVVQWLKEEDIYENVLLLPEDIEYVVLEKAGESSKKVEIRDPQVIEELLNFSNYLEDSGISEPLLVGFYIQKSSGFAHHMDYMPQSIPASDALRTYLNQLNTL